MNRFQKLVSNIVSSKTNLAIVVFMVAAGYFLVTEHTAHLLGAAPYLLLLACIGMHFFMHAGHGNHNNHEHKNNADSKEEKSL